MTIRSSIRSSVKSSIGNSVNMGEPKARWAPDFDGATTYIRLDEPKMLQDSWALTFKVKPSATVTQAVYGTVTSNYGFFRFSNGKPSISIVDGQITGFNTLSPVVVGVAYEYRVSYDYAVGILTVENLTLGESQAEAIGIFTTLPIQLIGAKGAGIDNKFNGLIYDVNLDGDLWSLNEPFSEYPALTSSLSNTATAYNFTSDDVVEILE